ncbi:uroporphyrinogen-III C-methyltransferase [Faecalibaculum rodentium]|uniref:uroporphyrinogen-III C-methyltransferase n=1 Tax=Faecalibaculum rodentium TaxID=1702221 RepID=UPI00255B096F|nr:uroporphyrinogen-III C-methyltransferase [Faecalibaculum rodentium]
MKQDTVTEIRQEPGTVILAGAGCGGRELLTLQVLDLIRRADVIVYDDLISQDILDIDTDAEWIYAGKRKGLHSMTQEEINELLISLAQTHALVLRLKGGDPFVFGRGREEMRAVREAGICCQSAPGITSAIAVPERFDIPVTDRIHASSFTVITASRKSQGKPFGADAGWVAHQPGTLVILMGLSRLPEIVEELIRAGKDPRTPTAVISSAEISHSEMVRGELSEITGKAAALQPPAIILIGDVVKEARLPQDMAGKEKPQRFTVWTTFTDDLTARVRRRLPDTIRLIPVLEAAHERVESAKPRDLETDWIVLTSRRGAGFFLEDLKKQKLDLRKLPKIAVVGKATAEVLEEAGLYPDLVPETAETPELVRELKRAAEPGSRILLLRAREADHEMETALETDFRVMRKDLYDIRYSSRDLKRLPGPDLMAFASRSAVRAWKEPVPCPVLCISDITASQVHQDHPEASVLLADEISAAGLAETIIGLSQAESAVPEPGSAR